MRCVFSNLGKDKFASTQNTSTHQEADGTDLYNSWEFSKVVVDNGSSLNVKKYGTIEAATIDVVASMRSVMVGKVNIPTDKTQARLKFSGLKGYNMGTAPWLSATIVGKLGDIN